MVHPRERRAEAMGGAAHVPDLSSGVPAGRARHTPARYDTVAQETTVLSIKT